MVNNTNHFEGVLKEWPFSRPKMQSHKISNLKSYRRKYIEKNSNTLQKSFSESVYKLKTYGPWWMQTDSLVIQLWVVTTTFWTPVVQGGWVWGSMSESMCYRKSANTF